MLRCLTTLWLALLWYAPTIGQTAVQSNKEKVEITVFPVRVGHKTGYIKIYEQESGLAVVHTIVPPKYDCVMSTLASYLGRADKLSPYKLYEHNEKLGIMDQRLREILLPNYDKIKVVSDRLFVVQTDADKGFQLIDANRQLRWGGEAYDEIVPAQFTAPLDPTDFFVRKGKVWKLKHIDGTQYNTPDLAAVGVSEAEGYYKVRTSATAGYGWQLMERSGNLIVRQPVQDLRVLSSTFIMVKNGATWQMLESSARAAKEDIRFAAKLNDHWAIVASQQNESVDITLKSLKAKSAKIDTAGGKTAIPVLKTDGLKLNEQIKQAAYGNQAGEESWFFPLDDAYVVYYKTERKDRITTISVALVDTSGALLPDKFRKIELFGRSGLYRTTLLGSREMAIYQPARLQNSQFATANFDYIYPLVGDVAVCSKGVKYGLLGVNGNSIDTLPCVHNKAFVFSGNQIQLQIGDNAMSFQYAPGQGFRANELVGGGKVVAENAEFSMTEAIGMSLQQMAALEANDSEQIRLRSVQSKLDCVRDTIAKSTRLRSSAHWKKDWKLVLPSQSRMIDAFEIVTDTILAIVQSDTLTRCKTLSTQFGIKIKNRVRLFHGYRGAYFEAPFLCGLRDFNTDHSTTAFIDSSGQMGLINLEGKEIAQEDGAPLRFTFIGPFVDGRARVCIGGKLVADYNDKHHSPNKFRISSLGAFLEAYHIYNPMSSSLQALADAPVIVVGTCVWATIDQSGQVLFKTEHAYVDDFMPGGIAPYAQKNNRESMGRPDADYGFIDSTGRTISPAMFTSLISTEQYHLVGVDSTPTFYFTQNGLQIFTNSTRLRPLSEGFAQFRDPQTNLWGYVSKMGVITVKPQYVFARPFSEGLALVATPDSFCHFIDTTGQQVFSTGIKAATAHRLGDYHDNRCWVSDSTGLWACYNQEGKLAFQKKYYFQSKAKAPDPDAFNPLPLDFRRRTCSAARPTKPRLSYVLLDIEGNETETGQAVAHLAAMNPYGIAVTTDTAGLKGLINSKGQTITPNQFKAIQPFVNGFAVVQAKNGFFGLVNTTGKRCVPTEYVQLDTVYEGRINAQLPGPKPLFAVLDTNGMQVGNMQFKLEPSPFQNGNSMFEGKDSYYFINHDCVIDSNYVFAKKPLFYSSGYVGTETESGRFAYSDLNGTNLFGTEYQEISPFILGAAKVGPGPYGTKRKVYGAINRRGIQTVPCKYRMVHLQPDGNIITNPQRFYGLFDRKGNQLLPPLYDLIEHYKSTNLFRVEQGEAIGYVQIRDGKAEWIWELQK